MTVYRTSTNLLGASGELHVAAMLCRLGWAASLAPPGFAAIDLVAIREDAPSTPPLLVQCKATRAGSSAWISVDLAAPRSAPANAWAVLVSFDEHPTAAPAYYVMPMQSLLVFAWAGLANKERNRHGAPPTTGRGRGALNPRDFEAYGDRWDLLWEPAPLTLPYPFLGGFWEWLDGLEVPPWLPSPQPGELPERRVPAVR